MGGVGSILTSEPASSSKDGTVLVELEVLHLRDAHEAIGMRPNTKKNRGRWTGLTPLVIRAAKAVPTCCCVPCCYVSIPSGFSAIVTKFGAEVQGDLPDGSWSPGCHCFSPFNTVDKLVTQQMIVFDTPVQNVKTADNINVTIDVVVVFVIEQAKDFVYQLGAEKFDDRLRNKEAEVLRTWANEIMVEDVHDLRSRDGASVLADFNNEFGKYGVKFTHFTVRSVVIPNNMATDFENKTLYDTQDHEKKMTFTSDRLQMSHKEGQSKLREECDNARLAAEEQAEVTKAVLGKEIKEIENESNRAIIEVQTTREADVRQVNANAELEVAKMQSEIMKIEREIKSSTAADVGRLAAQTIAYRKSKEAEGRIEEAAKLASGKRALAEGEGEASSAFAARRQQEAEMSRLNILDKLAKNTQIQIATSQENTMGLNADNQMVTQIAAQGLEALRAKLAEVTARSVAKLEQPPARHTMKGP